MPAYEVFLIFGKKDTLFLKIADMRILSFGPPYLRDFQNADANPLILRVGVPSLAAIP